MQKKLFPLSLLVVAGVLVTLNGCWHKKRCCPQEEPCHEAVAQDTCVSQCSGMVADEDIEEELELSHERVSGPRGWPQEAMK